MSTRTLHIKQHRLSLQISTPFLKNRLRISWKQTVPRCQQSPFINAYRPFSTIIDHSRWSKHMTSCHKNMYHAFSTRAAAMQECTWKPIASAQRWVCTRLQGQPYLIIVKVAPPPPKGECYPAHCQSKYYYTHKQTHTTSRHTTSTHTQAHTHKHTHTHNTNNEQKSTAQSVRTIG